MEEPKIVKMSIQRTEIFNYIHKDLSRKNILKVPHSLKWLIGMIISMVVIIALSYLKITFFHKFLFAIIPITIFCLSIYKRVIVGENYFKAKYPEYLKVINSVDQYDEFVLCYRVEETYKKLKSANFCFDNIDDYINYYERKGLKSTEHARNFLIILVAFLFSIWNEFVGINLGEGWGKIVLFVLYAVIFSSCVFGINSLLQKTLFNKLNRNKEVAEILVEVKNRKNEVNNS